METWREFLICQDLPIFKNKIYQVYLAFLANYSLPRPLIFICRQKYDQGKDNDMNKYHFLIISNIQQCTASQCRIRNITKSNSVHWPSYPQLLQKTALSLVKSRLALGSPGCLFGCYCLSPCQKWPNSHENVCRLPPSDHI